MNRLLPFSALLGGLLLAALAGYSQSQPYRFTLQAEKLDAPASPWQVTRVLDLRADRSQLGKVRRGLGNETASADFIQSLAAELTQFLRARQPVQAGARPVLVRVFTLALAEDLRANSEHAEAELVADFLLPQPDSTFQVLLRVGETTRRGGLDVTKFHPANVALVLQQGLRKLAALPAPPTPTETLSRADALAGRGGVATQRFAIQGAAEPARGFYRSYQEFLSNAPSEPDYPFAITHVAHTGKRWAGTDEIQVNYLGTDDAHPTRPLYTGNLWGLSDGKEVLIAYRNRFYKLLPAADGRSYTFTGPPVFDEKAATNVAVAGVMGGALGAALAGAANGTNVMAPYELHLASGRVVAAQDAGQTDADGFATAPDTAKIYVYRRPDAAKDQVVTFSASGRPAAALQARQWTALTWQDRRHELKLCVQVGQGPESCKAFVPDFSQPTYLECVVPAGGGAPTLRPVPAKEGLFELRRIQRLAKAAR
ncbi:hypothetical protein [Hymenobacter armeniacus]|uniref:Uncharacterized protein n=1 Tax=Hymenobacter armeniacus TaxID=2771358 RepID=A0ABR8JVZ4_9BACT|nr:hypothetical protein [Hymenobacter armeniacus]MBD2721914.1 hypothetical protein [Hymenobacter armeniacus]